jgi:hypothetical protein
LFVDQLTRPRLHATDHRIDHVSAGALEVHNLPCPGPKGIAGAMLRWRYRQLATDAAELDPTAAVLSNACESDER